MEEKKYKVLYITNIPAPYTVAFYNELGKFVDLTVLFERRTADNREASWFTSDDVGFNAVYLKGIKFGDEAALCPSVKKYLKKKFDLIIIGNYASPTGIIAIRYLKRKKIPFYVHADGGIITDDKGWKFKLKKKLLSAAGGYFSSSKATDEYFAHYGNGSLPCLRYPFTSTFKAQIRDSALTYAQKSASKRRAELYEEKFVALFVGSIIERKGVDILLDAACSLKEDTGVYIIGGQPTEKLRAQMEQNSLTRVHFLPFMPTEKVLEYMRYADVFVFPTRFDIWGLVVNEALSQGLPVITTDKCVAGVEMIENGANGFIVPAEDGGALAEKINYLHDDTEVLDRMGGVCLERIAAYSIENMAEIYYGHIEGICKGAVER